MMLDEPAKPANTANVKPPVRAHVARAWNWARADAPAFVSRSTKFFFENFNTLVIKLPGAIAFIFILWIVVDGLTQHVTVIQPLSVPKELEERGYTPEVAGKRLRDALDKFAKSVNTAMKDPEIALQGELPNIVVPSVGISLDALVASLRTLLRSTRSKAITGEFTSLGNGLWLRLRLDGHEIFSSQAGHLERPDDLLTAAAPEIFRQIKPFLTVAALRSNNNPTAALTLANALLYRLPETDENVPWLYGLKSGILYEIGDYVPARHAAEKALTLDPSINGIHLTLGVLYSAEGNETEAALEYAAAMAMDSSTAAAHNDVAYDAFLHGDTATAKREYEAAIKLTTSYALAHRNLGELYRLLKQNQDAAGEYATAIEQYRAHLAHSPKDFANRIQLAYALRLHNDYDASTAEFTSVIDQLRRTVASEPKNAFARKYLGDALYGLKRYGEAAVAYQEVLALAPDAVGMHYRVGESLIAAKRYGDAVAPLRQAIKTEPHFALAHGALGSALAYIGKRDEAIAEYRAAIAIDGNNAQFHDDLASSLQAAGRTDEAIAEFRTALQINPHDATAHIRWGLMLRVSGKLDEAIAQFRKAIDVDGRTTAAHYDLGLTLRQQGKIDEAVAEYRAALQIDPSYLLGHEGLAEALSDQGNKAEAIDEYRKVLAIDPNDGNAQRHLKLLGASL
jgi:tetratricopeptide (TPR) repeat protein